LQLRAAASGVEIAVVGLMVTKKTTLLRRMIDRTDFGVLCAKEESLPTCIRGQAPHHESTSARRVSGWEPEYF